MQIELDISERLVRKIRALNMLLGGHSSNFEGLLSELLERSVSEAIAGELGLFGETRPAEQPDNYEARADDVTGISDGLGDEEDSTPPEPVRSMTDVIPRRGGLTDQVLDDDMTISDPEHEAKADAASFEDEVAAAAENLFADLAGLPAPANTRRKKSPSLRGRVTPFNGVEESTI